jgi:hypothetical protein
LFFFVFNSHLLAEMSILSTIQFADNTTCYDFSNSSFRFVMSKIRHFIAVFSCICNTLARVIQPPKTCFYVSLMTPFNTQTLVFILVKNEKLRFFPLFYPLIYARICCMHVYTHHNRIICFVCTIFDFPALIWTRWCSFCRSIQ